MSYGEIPRGLADLQVAPLTGNTPGTWVDIPGARTLSFNADADSDELEGDNAIIAKVMNPPSLSGSIEIGRLNPAAMAVLIGSTASTTGTTPNAVTTLDQKSDINVSYYQIAGQAPGVDAEDSAYRVIIMKALSTSGPDESLEVNSWNTPTIDFEGLDISGVLVRREFYEKSVALPPSS